jgi:hypothetical protein
VTSERLEHGRSQRMLQVLGKGSQRRCGRCHRQALSAAFGVRLDQPMEKLTFKSTRLNADRTGLRPSSWRQN